MVPSRDARGNPEALDYYANIKELQEIRKGRDR